MDDAAAEELAGVEFVKSEAARAARQASRAPLWATLRQMTPEELDPHQLLADAILGRCPPYSMILELQDRSLGTWAGGHYDRWDWNGSAIRELGGNDLTELYQRLRSTS